MAIQSGTHVGPSEILSAIGAGKMGQAYGARDPNLEREKSDQGSIEKSCTTTFADRTYYSKSGVTYG